VIVATAPTGMRRTIGLWRSTAMVIGTIIGASIFVQPSEITGQVPTVGGILLVWLLAGVLTLLGCLVTAELASAFPRSGGVYEFLRQAYAPSVGFLWGWGMFWSMHSGIIAAIAVIFARYMAFFIPLDASGTRAVAVAGILVLSAINYVGVRSGSIVQTAFTAGKVLAIAVMIVIGLLLGGQAASPSGAEAVAAPAPSFQTFALAMIAGLFAYGGWHMVTYAADETIEPRTTIPRALLIGVGTVTVCYLLLNVVYVYVLPVEAVRASSRVAADAADAVIGTGGAAFMSGLVVFSTFGALSGIILAGPRVYYSMARDGLLFRRFGEVHPRFRTPHRAIVVQALWASVLVVTGTYRELFTRVIYTEWAFFALMAAGLLVLRRRPDYEPTYRMPFVPVAPLVFVAASAVIVFNQIVSDPVESLTGLLLVAAGAPVFLVWTRWRDAKGGFLGARN
jgi:APA family basic amino acid/polyamine antiporter